MYESSFKDLLKIWLYTEGPEAILRYISIKKGVERNIYPRHVCAACRELFSDKENYEKTFMIADKINEDIINECIVAIKNNFNDVYTTLGEEKLRNIIIINLQMK